MFKAYSILIFESDPVDAAFLTNTIIQMDRGKEHRVEVNRTLKEGLRDLDNEKFDVILLNLSLPDCHGIASLQEVLKKVSSTPVIIIGEGKDEEQMQEALKLGAQDFLPKSEITAVLLTRIIHYAIERHMLYEGLKSLSFTDELTGLYNRRGFLTLIEQQIALAHRMKKGFFLILVDLDYLKKINDTYGHLIGDRAIIHLARLLISSFRHYDIIGRIGGDEFAIMALNTHEENGDNLKNHMLNKLEQFNLSLHEPYKLSFSIGMTYYGGHYQTSVDELFQEADISLYIDKRETH